MAEPKVKKETKVTKKEISVGVTEITNGNEKVTVEVTCPNCLNFLVDCTCKTEEAVPIEKSLGNTTVDGAKKNVSDLVIYGNGDMFQLLCKASSKREGWMKSTKAMQVFGGCVVQVTTQQRNPDGSYAIAEALQFVPGVKIACVDGDKTKGRFLTRI